MLVVYTALFGDYDTLRDPIESFGNCKFICFTDQNNLTSDVWEIRVIKDTNLPPNEMNRKYKLLPHLFLSNYDQSLYIDSNISLMGNPAVLLRKHARNGFFMSRHFARDCIYDEALECAAQKKGHYGDIFRQMRFYKTQGMPKGFGLGDNSILLRDHNDPKVIRLMEEWWLQINTYSKRDQLSLAYVLWKNGEEFTFLDETSPKEKGIFKYEQHKLVIKRSVHSRVVNRATSALKCFYLSKVLRR